MIKNIYLQCLFHYVKNTSCFECYFNYEVITTIVECNDDIKRFLYWFKKEMFFFSSIQIKWVICGWLLNFYWYSSYQNTYTNWYIGNKLVTHSLKPTRLTFLFVEATGVTGSIFTMNPYVTQWTCLGVIIISITIACLVIHAVLMTLFKGNKTRG